MRIRYRYSLAIGMLLATLSLSTVSPASAQPVPAPNRSVQAVPPAQGAIVWGPQDNCAYQFQNGSWYRQDICRVMQGPLAYVTYRPSTGQRLAMLKGAVMSTSSTSRVGTPSTSGPASR